MLTVPLAIIMVIVYVCMADTRAANHVAHEICPDTHVVRVDDRFEFGCDGRDYAVVCDDGECATAPL
ncbi:MAG: hypothetical protein ACQGVC_22545 [Myxococcota bacterium]